MVSVCMATKNGIAYLGAQLNSILHQIKPEDEVVICDDCSSDATVALIESFNDPRIRIIRNTSPQGIAKTFERSLLASKGTYIFLADQDDVWKPEKISITLKHLKLYEMVISDCIIADHALKPMRDSFFMYNKSRKGLLRNIYRNSYMGCCMAFHRDVLKRALPFPKDIPLHDFWLGLIGELYFDVLFIPKALMYHRRHSTNASTTGTTSQVYLHKKIKTRYQIVKNLFFHKFYAA